MKAAGIITEYNPFHKGHRYHIARTREITGCDLLIAVTSGHFVQRGEPSLIDKWQKAELALKNGVDLVVELPFIYSCQAAGQFAEGAVRLLQIAQVSDIVFGSESNNLEELQQIASMPISVNNLRENMKTGISFPKAYGLMAKEYLPNDILAIAYLRAMKDTGILPHSIQRISEYNSLDLSGEFVSAGAIRNAFFAGEDISSYTDAIVDRKHAVRLADYFPLMRMILLSHSAEDLSKLFLMDEGIENHLKDSAESALDFTDFLEKAVTRRYTRSRIQRTLLMMLLYIKKEEVALLPELDTLYVLGFNDRGRQYLKECEEKGIKTAVRYNRQPIPYRRIQYKAAQLYSLFRDDRETFLKREIQGPVIL